MPSSPASWRRSGSGPRSPCSRGADVVGKSGSFGNYDVDDPRRRARRGVHLGSRRLDHRGHRLRLLPAGGRRVRLRHRRRPDAAGVHGPARSLERATRPPREAGPERGLRLLRRQPPGCRRRRRQRVLLALLLHGRRPRVRQGGRAGRDGPPVPPVPRHAHVRQVRDDLHAVARAGLGLRAVPRRRAARRRARRGRPAGRSPSATSSPAARSWRSRQISSSW